MRRLAATITVAVVIVATTATAAPHAGAATGNVYTPVLAQLLGSTNPAPVLGTDRRHHVLYELILRNRGRIPATIEKVELLDFETGTALTALAGAALRARIRDTSGLPAADAAIEPGGERLLLVDVSYRGTTTPPVAFEHRFHVLGPRGPRATRPTAIDYVTATVPLDGPAPPVLSPPVAGNGWVVTSGCCDAGNPHRSAVLPVNGVLWHPLRFGFEMMQLDDEGFFARGDATQLGDFTTFGRDVLSVAPGRVVALLDSLPDQAAGAVSDPDAASFELDGGNYVVVDIGNGVYAYYGNLQQGSLLVTVGDRVQRRQVLGTIGNSSDGYPRLHFRVMSDPSPFASDGLPFVLSQFAYEGQLDASRFFLEGIVGNYLDNREPNPVPRRRELPLGFAIIDFTVAGGSGAAGRT